MILSIIIPTKNRYSTLMPLVDALTEFPSQDFEIIIQDNSDQNSTALEYLKMHNDSRIKYFYESGKLSVIENGDLAVKNSRGEYICFIGDDDGVMPYIVDVAVWMKAKGYEALKSHMPNYYWPGQRSNYLSGYDAGLLSAKAFDYGVDIKSSQNGLSHTLARGGTTMAELPCLYHGVVQKKVLDKIYSYCNTYFPGPSPDMANAIALVKTLNEFVFVNFPVVISGKSIKSTGGQGVLHNHLSRIEDVAHLPKETAHNWSSMIPRYWTGPTIWAESVLKALQATNSNEDVRSFRYSYLYASLLVFNFSHRKQIFRNFRGEIFTVYVLIDAIKIFINRSIVFIKNRVKIGKPLKKNNVKNIGEAIKFLQDSIDENRLPFLVRD